MRVGALVAVLVTVAGCAPIEPSPGAQSTGVRLAGAGYDCRIASVVDGDTVKIACRDGSSVNARLIGYDTPETYAPGCAAERALGKQATRYLRNAVNTAQDIHFADYRGRDKYDRMLLRLLLDGRDVGQEMIARGLAVAYDGGRRIDWCDRLR